MVRDFTFYLTGRYSFIFCFLGECQLGALYSVFVVLLGISIHFSYISVCFVASCSGGLMYSLVVCATWAGALWCWLLGGGGGGAQCSMQGLFVIFYFSGGRQLGCSLQYIMVLIIFILFLFWCFFLDILFYWAVVSSVPSAAVLPVAII